jgi:hypothetical protein
MRKTLGHSLGRHNIRNDRRKSAARPGRRLRAAAT